MLSRMISWNTTIRVDGHLVDGIVKFDLEYGSSVQFSVTQCVMEDQWDIYECLEKCFVHGTETELKSMSIEVLGPDDTLSPQLGIVGRGSTVREAAKDSIFKYIDRFMSTRC